MSDWPSVALEALAADERSAISKPYGSAFTKDDYATAGVPVVRGVNLARGRFHDDDFVYVSQELAARMPGAELRSGDLVATHRGTVGQVSMIPRQPRFERYLASTSSVKIRLNESHAVPEFYCYWFASKAGQQSILENVSTVGVPGLAQPVATVKRLRVPRPPVETQRAIAEVLGALDDKIAANVRLADTAVTIADTRFASAKRHGSLSDQTFADIAAVAGGGTPRTSVDEYWNGEIPWATPTDVTALSGPYLGATGRSITQAGLDACASALYPPGSILMTSRATIGAFAIASQPTAVNQGFIVVNANDPRLQWWLFHEMRSRVPDFISHANGATFLELTRGKFKQFRVHLADRDEMVSFGAVASALHGRARAADEESANLAATRDALLPLLMSGKVRVKDAEKVVEGVV